MNKEQLVLELIKFAEGDTDFTTFWNNYQKNKEYNKIFEVKLGDKFRCFGKGTVNEHFAIYSPSTSMGKAVIHSDVCRYLEYHGYSFIKYSKYHDDLQFRIDIQPKYIYIDDEEFLNKIIADAPKELSKAKQKLWLKEKIKDLFKYDSKPPRWIQDPEWPIVDGKPLVFRNQTKEKSNDERVYYIFYNLETKEETKVMQFY